MTRAGARRAVRGARSRCGSRWGRRAPGKPRRAHPRRAALRMRLGALPVRAVQRTTRRGRGARARGLGAPIADCRCVRGASGAQRRGALRAALGVMLLVSARGSQWGEQGEQRVRIVRLHEVVVEAVYLSEDLISALGEYAANSDQQRLVFHPASANRAG